MMIVLFCLLVITGNTRVINQKELEYFRQELQARLTNNYSVLLKSKQLPLSLLQDHQKVNTYVYFYHPDIDFARAAHGVLVYVT